MRPELNRIVFLLCFGLFVLSLGGCQSAIEKAKRNVGYSAYEMVGIEKRDLLKSRVKKARSEQKEASEDFGTALDRLKAITKFDGGSLEKRYRSLQSSYDRANDQSAAVRAAIDRVEVTAADLFEEWDKEIREIETPSLRDASRRKLDETRAKSSALVASLRRSEKTMTPILSKLKDQTLFLKHNLNAQAIGSLKTEAVRIQNDIEKLLKEMNVSIEHADRLIRDLESE